jgi:hypothetical protein
MSLMGWVFKIDKNNKAESPDIKVMGFFCFVAGLLLTTTTYTYTYTYTEVLRFFYTDQYKHC